MFFSPALCILRLYTLFCALLHLTRLWVSEGYFLANVSSFSIVEIRRSSGCPRGFNATFWWKTRAKDTTFSSQLEELPLGLLKNQREYLTSLSNLCLQIGISLIELSFLFETSQSQARLCEWIVRLKIFQLPDSGTKISQTGLSSQADIGRSLCSRKSGFREIRAHIFHVDEELSCHHFHDPSFLHIEPSVLILARNIHQHQVS